MTLSHEQLPLDTARFADPLAARVGWTPVARSGSSGPTHRLKEVGQDRVEFCRTRTLTVLAILVLTLGIAMCCLGLLLLAGFDISKHNAGGTPIVLFGAVFIACGAYLLGPAGTAVFDRRIGWFHKGNPPPSLDAPGVIRLSTIHALQILGEDCTTSKGQSYRSFELNLVLKDGTRHNVVDYNGLVEIREDACRLARFLKVPVWDVA